MNTLKYKGFIGSVEFNEEDNVFFGKIEGIDGIVNYESSSVDELKSAFHEAVENYIAYRKKENVISPALQAKIDLTREEIRKGQCVVLKSHNDVERYFASL